MGNCRYLSWRSEYVCSDDEFERKLGEDAERLEQDLERWRVEVNDCRRQFLHLNFFTLQQLVVLQRELFLVDQRGRTACHQIPASLHALLGAIKPNIESKDIYQAVTKVLAKKSTEGGSLGSSLAKLTQQGISARVAKAALAVKHGNLEEALEWATMYGTNERKLAAAELLFDSDDEVEAMDIDMAEEDHAMADYLDLKVVGRILDQLSKATPGRHDRQIPDYLAWDLNLLVVPEADIFATVLGLYRSDARRPLPTDSEVLVCSSQTTTEDVALLWRRALFDKSCQLYCLVNADQLDYAVSAQAMVDFEAIQKESQLEARRSRIAVVCSRENEDHAWILSALDQFRCDPRPCTSYELQQYLLSKFQSAPQELGARETASAEDSDQSCVRIIASERTGVGKSLFIQRVGDRVREMRCNDDILHQLRHADPLPSTTISIPVQGNRVDVPAVLDILNELTSNHSLRRVFHFDVAPSVSKGLDAFLFDLLVLSAVMDDRGRVWRRSVADLYVVEVTCTSEVVKRLSEPGRLAPMFSSAALPFFSLLPVHLCGPPQDALRLLECGQGSVRGSPLVDQLEFDQEAYQRVFAYLNRFSQNSSMENFSFQPGCTSDLTQEQCLGLLMEHCGVPDPSWLVLRNFVQFLNVQLRDSENSFFCQMELVGDDASLEGFPTFVIRFMMQMSKDFATPSLQVDRATEQAADDIFEYKLRRRWEQTPHPYLFFNQDHVTMTFLGFNVTSTGDLVDVRTSQILQPGIMSQKLHRGLSIQRVNLNENHANWNRQDMLMRLGYVLGNEYISDPDDTYELTLDNVLKIMAIQMRFRCGIPVVVMGETGCGKTRLIRFMCQLQAGFTGATNLLMMKVHGGTTESDVQRKVVQAEICAEENAKRFDIDTVLFFDEANTSEALGLIKEVMCDGRVRGRPLRRPSRLRVIAACNPYRRHTAEMIRRLEEAGLGYHVHAEETEDTLGRIPLRQLVYRVHQLPGKC